MPDFPVEMVNVHNGDVRVVETALTFNNLATSGYKVKNKKKEVENTSDSAANSDPAVSDSQTSEGAADVPVESTTENAAGVAAPADPAGVNVHRRGRNF